MLATTPASRPNWCAPISRRAGPVAYGFSDTEPNESIIDGSRNTSAPIGGPPQAIALTATTSASISSMSISRYGAAAEWSTTTSPPTSCTSLVTARRSVTVPSVDDAERDRDQPGRAGDQTLPLPGRQLAGLDVDLGPLDLGAIAIRRAQPRRDVRLVVEPGHHHLVAEADPRRRRVGQRRQQDRAVGAEHHAPRIGVDQIGHRLAGGLQHRRAAPRRRMRSRRRRHRAAERGRHRRRHGVGEQHAVSARRSAPNRRPATGADRAPGRRRMPCQPTLERLMIVATDTIPADARDPSSMPDRTGSPGQPY